MNSGLLATQCIDLNHGMFFATVVLAIGAIVAAVFSGRALGQERESLQATVRPVVVAVPLGLHMRRSNVHYLPDDLGRILWRREVDGGEVQLTVPMRNVGPGPAFVFGSWFSTSAANEAGECDEQVIPPGELVNTKIVASPSSKMNGQRTPE